MVSAFKSFAKRTLPPRAYSAVRSVWKLRRHPLVSRVRYGGGLRRVNPASRVFGYDRGRPVDRYYIEDFLARNSSDIRGRVLEIEDGSYTRRFGGDRVTKSEVLDVVESNPKATIIADLNHADDIPSDSFDCIVLTQTLQLIYDVRAAVGTLHRTLKPGGVLLLTLPCISQINHEELGRWYWMFTTLAVRRLFEEVFPEDAVEVETHGNVFSAVAFLHGLSAEELSRRELDHRDPEYQVITTLRAVKPGP